jgi:hypothetical protein
MDKIVGAVTGREQSCAIRGRVAAPTTYLENAIKRRQGEPCFQVNASV